MVRRHFDHSLRDRRCKERKTQRGLAVLPKCTGQSLLAAENRPDKEAQRAGNIGHLGKVAYLLADDFFERRDDILPVLRKHLTSVRVRHPHLASLLEVMLKLLQNFGR
eukprot:6698918-Prymnesium_polylepis.1